jgi:hypothetical protein
MKSWRYLTNWSFLVYNEIVMRWLISLLLMAILLPLIQASVYADDALGGVIEIGQVETPQILVVEEVPGPKPTLIITDYIEPKPLELEEGEKIPAPSHTYDFTYTLGPTSTPIKLKIDGEKVAAPEPEFTITGYVEPEPSELKIDEKILAPSPTLIPVNPPNYPPFGPIPIEENYPPYGPVPINPPYLAPYDPVAIDWLVRNPIPVPNRIRLMLRNNLRLIWERIFSLAL